MDREILRIARSIIPEGIVLLENDGSLPLSKTDRVAVFGRAQFEYVKSGSGSAGRVVSGEVTQFYDELKNVVEVDETVSAFYRDHIATHPYDYGDGWTFAPCQHHPFVTDEFVSTAAMRNDKAIFVIGRVCGESGDFLPDRGSWYLSEAEEQTIKTLAKHFAHVIVLINGGNLIDCGFISRYRIGTVAFVWQGGEQGAAGTVDALCGIVPPSGRLADTIAENAGVYPASGNFGGKNDNIHVEDIYVGYRYFETFAPEKVLYPFGYGLGYTEFETETIKTEKNGFNVSLTVRVTNIGNANGKEVVEVYLGAPCGKLGRPKKELVAYKKTGMLAPKETETLEISFDLCDSAAYDDGGCTGNRYCYVLESGDYRVFVGKNVRDCREEFSFSLPETTVTERLGSALAPVKPFERFVNRDGQLRFEAVPLKNYDTYQRIRDRLPAAIGKISSNSHTITLAEVADGCYTLDEFIAQFTPTELAMLVRGEGMGSDKALAAGSASVFGGVTAPFIGAGVPVMTTCDGPSGLRMESYKICTSVPSGAILACSFAPELSERMFELVAEEMRGYEVDILLAPSMNIHRHPLAGRSFEYYSEDPLVTAKTASAFVRGIYKGGADCTLKHFAVNSQETARGSENEIVSERALREIYLKPFEKVVKEGIIRYIMTSYNAINGFYNCSNYDLTTTILRDEWGYKGAVMTDWWANPKDAITGERSRYTLAEMVRAQNDLFMVVPDAAAYRDNIVSRIDDGTLTLGELQRSARNIFRVILASSRMKRRDYGYKPEAIPDKLLFEGDYKGENVNVPLPTDGDYYTVVRYRADGDELTQYQLTVRINELLGVIPVVTGTGKEEGTARFTITSPAAPQIRFEGTPKVTHFEIYSIKGRRYE